MQIDPLMHLHEKDVRRKRERLEGLLRSIKRERYFVDMRDAGGNATATTGENRRATTSDDIRTSGQDLSVETQDVYEL